MVRKDGTILNCYIQVRSLDRYNPAKGQIVAVIDLTGYKRTQKTLLQKEKELEHQTRYLKEVNTALKVLLEHRDNARKELEENILVSIEKLILPYIEKIEKGGSKREFATRLSIVKSNLKELVTLKIRPSPLRAAHNFCSRLRQ
uniref:Uncharacterized protein n=1 Tax=Candidatus Desulfatibia profunda TaxID=2841695 RepID=A0A8J6NUN3_9BACT|nr:hypothetical protein [Candidatus Desulfatibia profunda]